jgi:tetratricopeptide (TPR) repeat protein
LTDLSSAHQDLFGAGVAAFREGRYAEADADLQQASERLQTLRQTIPTNTTVTRLHGISLGFRAGAWRQLKRPREALAHYRESLAVLESMNAPVAGDFYNMSCTCAMTSALDDQASPADREKLQARAVEYLRRAIEESQAFYRPVASEDRDLDPLRGHADFRDLMADADFPRDPFAPP